MAVLLGATEVNIRGLHAEVMQPFSQDFGGEFATVIGADMVGQTLGDE